MRGRRAVVMVSMLAVVGAVAGCGGDDATGSATDSGSGTGSDAGTTETPAPEVPTLCEHTDLAAMGQALGGEVTDAEPPENTGSADIDWCYLDLTRDGTTFALSIGVSATAEDRAQFDATRAAYDESQGHVFETRGVDGDDAVFTAFVDEHQLTGLAHGRMYYVYAQDGTWETSGATEEQFIDASTQFVLALEDFPEPVDVTIDECDPYGELVADALGGEPELRRDTNADGSLRCAWYRGTARVALLSGQITSDPPTVLNDISRGVAEYEGYHSAEVEVGDLGYADNLGVFFVAGDTLVQLTHTTDEPGNGWATFDSQSLVPAAEAYAATLD